MKFDNQGISSVLRAWIESRNSQDVDVNLDLVASGVLDSFGFIEMVEMIEETFAIALPLQRLTATEAGTISGLSQIVAKTINGE